VYGFVLRFVRGVFIIHFYRTMPQPVLTADPGPPLAHKGIGSLCGMDIPSTLPEVLSARKPDGGTELLALCVAFKLDKTDEQEQWRDWYRLWHDE
jgi:hypothetical protein